MQVNLRRSFLINPKFQASFLMFMLAVALFELTAIYAANYYFFWKFQALGDSLHLASDNVFFQFLKQQKSAMNWVFIGLSVVIFLSLIIFGLVFSHRIAGPLHRLKVHFEKNPIKDQKKGSYQKVKFREGDFFRELADSYNQHISD